MNQKVKVEADQKPEGKSESKRILQIAEELFKRMLRSLADAYIDVFEKNYN